jgi:uncharacterized membrane protein
MIDGDNAEKPSSEPGLGRAAVTDERVARAIGNLLRAGVLISALVVAAGATIYLARHGGQQPHYRIFRGERHESYGISQVIREALAMQGQSIIRVGLLLLIATPVTRVLLAALAFYQQRDTLYVAVSMIVLSLLGVSLFGLTP